MRRFVFAASIASYATATFVLLPALAAEVKDPFKVGAQPDPRADRPNATNPNPGPEVLVPGMSTAAKRTSPQVAVQPSTEQEHPAGHHDDHGKDEGSGPKVTDWIQAASAFLSFIIAGIATLIARRLYVLTQSQVGIAAEQVRLTAEQANTAARQADIAEQAAALDRRLLVLAQRPRLLIERIRFLAGDDERQPFVAINLRTVRIDVTNAGGTDARILEARCFHYADRRGLPPTEAREVRGEGEIFELGPDRILQPGQQHTAYYPRNNEGNPFPLSPLDAEALNNGTAEFDYYLIGRVHYADEFNNRYVTRFIQKWDRENRSFVSVNHPYYGTST